MISSDYPSLLARGTRYHTFHATANVKHASRLRKRVGLDELQEGENTYHWHSLAGQTLTRMNSMPVVVSPARLSLHVRESLAGETTSCSSVSMSQICRYTAIYLPLYIVLRGQILPDPEGSGHARLLPPPRPKQLQCRSLAVPCVGGAEELRIKFAG